MLPLAIWNRRSWSGCCRRRMGAVVEKPSIYLDMTAEENLRQQYLVLDEPVNGLDPQGIIEMRELILKLNREYGITVLISSHILDELARLATHYGFIDGGHMVKEMSAEELEARCRKCTRVEASDSRVLARVLDRLGAEYRVVDDTRTDVFADVEATQLVAEAMKENCVIHSMKERDESLESFYMNLMGGAHHA